MCRSEGERDMKLSIPPCRTATRCPLIGGRPSSAICKARLIVGTLSLSGFLLAQNPAPKAPKFSAADFTLVDKDLKPQKSRVVLDSDGKGGGTFAVYGGSEQIQVSSLSFSGDGRILAVGSTPGRVDLWEVEDQKKLRTIDGGSTVGLSRDGRLLAKDSKDGKAIEVYDVPSGKLQRKIPRVMKRAENTVDGLVFSPDGTVLDVIANGDDDMVYEVSSGKQIAILTDTQDSGRRTGILAPWGLFAGSSMTDGCCVVAAGG